MREKLRILPPPTLLWIVMVVFRMDTFHTTNVAYIRGSLRDKALIQRLHIQHGQFLRHGFLVYTLLRLWYGLRYSEQDNPFENEIRMRVDEVQVRRG